jgi:hypothetical protein
MLIREGARCAVVTGFTIAALADIVYSASLPFLNTPHVSVGGLLVGRLLLGCAESFVAQGVELATSDWLDRRTPARSWPSQHYHGRRLCGRRGSRNSPLRARRLHLYYDATMLIPPPALAMTLWVQPVAASAARRIPFYGVIGAICLPGLGLPWNGRTVSPPVALRPAGPR